MFDIVKNKKNNLVKIILFIIIVPFAFFGIDSYFRDSDSSFMLFKIDNDNTVTFADFSNYYNNVVSDFKSRVNMNDPSVTEFLESYEFKVSVLNQLLNDRILYQIAIDSNFKSSSLLVDEYLKNIPGFITENNFDQNKYNKFLALRKVTDEQFRNSIAVEITTNQYKEYLKNLLLTSTIDMNEFNNVKYVKKNIKYFDILKSDVRNSIEVTNDDIKNYYEENINQFSIPEKIKVEYITYNKDSLNIDDVTDTEISDYYNNNITEFTSPEKRDISHILISFNETDKDQKKEEIQGYYQQIVDEKSTFENLARDKSDDFASSKSGGKLGIKSLGEMPPKFDEVAFGLSENTVSEPFETQFGYHIVKVNKIYPETYDQISNVSEKIKSLLKEQKQDNLFNSNIDVFKDLVYTNFDNFQEVSENLGLDIKTSQWIIKGTKNSEIIFNNSKLLDYLFSENGRENSEAIEYAEQSWVSARVIEKEEPFPLEFEQVKSEIEQFLLEDLTSEKVVEIGVDTLSKLNADDNAISNWSENIVVDRFYSAFDQEQIDLLFTPKDIGDTSKFRGILLSNGNYRVFSIDNVVMHDSKNDDYQQARSELQKITSDELILALVNNFRNKNNIQINLDLLKN